jgi:enhancing lycopene biosynthesis protein 2
VSRMYRNSGVVLNRNYTVDAARVGRAAPRPEASPPAGATDAMKNPASDGTPRNAAQFPNAANRTTCATQDLGPEAPLRYHMWVGFPELATD